MPDLAERIRTYIDTAQPVVTLNEIKTTVDRRLRDDPRDRVDRPSKWLLRGSLAVAAVVILVAVLVGVSKSDQGTRARKSPTLALAPALKVLHSVAALADAQKPLVPGPGQYLYVRTLGASVVTDGAKSPTTGQEEYWTYYIQDVRQTWTNSAGPNATSTAEVGVPQFLTNTDRAAWQAAGSPAISAGGGGSLPISYLDVTDLPTDPTKMAAFLTTHADQSVADLTSSPVWQFDEASQYLGAGASATQRAALFSFMATLPGVVNYGTTTTIGSDAQGIAIGIPGTNGERVEAVIDTSTSNILEVRTVIADPPEYISSGLAGGWNARVGESEVYFDYVSTGIVDSNSATPANAPAIPSPWPFGATQPPAASVAYPNL